MLAADATLVGFARALRAAGVDASAERLQAFLRAVDVLGAEARTDVYWAGRLTLCGGRDDLERYERVFAAWFGPGPQPRAARRPAPRPRPRLATREGTGATPDTGGNAAPDAPPAAAAASPVEVLRHRDVAGLDPAQRQQLHRLLAAFALRGA
ncbi:hypothetical protein I3F54_25540, partial [Streptomyces sp. MUM 2J]|nr:hypothetical protein [Streptomyces sp. MUM 2J]